MPWQVHRSLYFIGIHLIPLLARYEGNSGTMANRTMPIVGQGKILKDKDKHAANPDILW